MSASVCLYFWGLGSVRKFEAELDVVAGTFKSGHADQYSNNKCVIAGCSTDAQTGECVCIGHHPLTMRDSCERVGNIGGCDPHAIHSVGMVLSSNAYYTAHANATLKCGGREVTLAGFQAAGKELQSTAHPLPTDAQLVKWAREKLGL